ncbi:MAG: malate dehydrogenase, partial [Stenotrophomonas sp.]
WVLGSNGKWVTMGVPSDGSYGIPEGVIFGFAVTTENGEYTLVKDLPVDDFSQKYIDKTLAELEEERSGVAHLLG